MKIKIFIIALMMFIAVPAFGSPFLVSDPYAPAIGGKFEIREGGTIILTANNQPDGSIKANLSSVTPGLHNYEVRYVITDPLWGTVTSEWVPFSFTRPSIAPGSLKGFKLVP